jgi:hypothetical protein
LELVVAEAAQGQAAVVFLVVAALKPSAALLEMAVLVEVVVAQAQPPAQAAQRAYSFITDRTKTP